MNVDSLKLELVRLLLQTHEKSILLKIKEIYNTESTDWWTELSEEEQQEIDQGIKEADQGLSTSHNEVMQRFDQWK